MDDLKGGYVFRSRKTQADNRLLLNMLRATFEKMPSSAPTSSNQGNEKNERNCSEG